MPTGYTASVNDGITFQQFAMNCARAFGACISMRDAGGDGSSIPERFEPSDYHVKKIESTECELAALKSMTGAEIHAASKEEYENDERRRLERLKLNCDQLLKYRAMLEKVQAWQPPTPGHAGLHSFMIQQLTDSIKFDDMTKFYSTPSPVKTPESWFEEKLEKARRDVEYHKGQYAEEVKRTEERNAWISLLRASLN